MKYPYSLPRPKDTDELFDRMEEIIRNDMLVHQYYISPSAVDPTRQGSLCGGHRFCAIGTLMFAAGQPIIELVHGQYALEGVHGSARNRVAEICPALARARAALNKVAQEMIDQRAFRPTGEDIAGEQYNPDALEVLFENYEGVTHDVLLRVVEEARFACH